MLCAYVRALYETVAIFLSKKITLMPPRFNANFLKFQIIFIVANNPHLLHMNLFHLSISFTVFLYVTYVLPYYFVSSVPIPILVRKLFQKPFCYKICTRYFLVLLHSTKSTQKKLLLLFLHKICTKHFPS